MAAEPDSFHPSLPEEKSPFGTRFALIDGEGVEPSNEPEPLEEPPDEPLSPPPWFGVSGSGEDGTSVTVSPLRLITLRLSIFTLPLP